MITDYFNTHPHIVRRLFASFAVAVALYSFIHIYRVVSLPTDENVFRDTKKGLMIVEVLPSGASDRAGLRVGDIITRVNDRTFKNAYEADSILRRTTIGHEIDYTILRDGTENVYKVRVAQFGIPLAYLAGILLACCFFIVGILPVSLRPEYPAARSLGVSFLLFSLYFFITANIPQHAFDDILAKSWRFVITFALTSGIAVLTRLCLEFPSQKYSRPYPWWFFFVYLPPFLLLALTPGGGKELSLFVPITISIQIAVAFLMPNFFLRKKRIETDKTRSRYVNIAYVIIAASFGLAFILELLGITSTYRLYVAILVVTLPVSYAYTIIRYRVFDIYLVIRKSLLYTISTGILTAAFVIGILAVINALPSAKLNLPAIRVTSRSLEVVTLQQLHEPERSQIEKSMLISFGIMLTFLLWQAQKWGRFILEKKFYRQRYDYRKAMHHFSRVSARVTDRDTLAREVVQNIFEIMHLKGAALAFVQNGSFRIRESMGLKQDCCRTVDLKQNDVWAHELSQLRTSQSIANLGAKELFRDTGIQFITPVISHDVLEGLLLLGEKHSETNYTKDDVELLDAIAGQVAVALETMRLYEEVNEKERMKRELEIARKIQISSLPAEVPQIPGLDIAAFSQPALEVGGDFYDFLIRHDQVTFILGDVSGKGTSAALYMSRVQGIIRSLDSYHPSLWELFVRLNNLIYGHIERKSFVTLMGVRVNLLDHRTTFIRAGHLPLLHFHAASNSIEIYQPLGLGIGLDERQFSSTLSEQAIHPTHGDVILLFSDGVTEALNDRNEEYGLEQLQHVLARYAEQPAEQIKSEILSSLTSFAGTAHQHDDITCVIVKVT